MATEAAVADEKPGTQETPDAAQKAEGEEEEVEIEWQADLPPEASTVAIAEGEEGKLAAGKQVEVVGTQKNGSIGELVEFLSEKSRWKVRFASGASNNFKPENLRVLKGLEASVTPAGEKPVPAAAAADQKPTFQVGLMSDAIQMMKKASLWKAEDEDEDVLQLPKRKPPKEKMGQASSTGSVASSSAPAKVTEKPAKLARVQAEEEKPAQPAQPAVRGGEGAGSGGGAEAAGVAGTEEATETAAVEQEGVTLAGQTFATQRALVEHLKAVQAKLEEKSRGSSAGTVGDQAKNGSALPSSFVSSSAAGAAAPAHDQGGIVEGQDMFLLFHLIMQHPRTAEKLRAPLKAIRYGTYQKMKNKCFVLVFSDGMEEPVSWNKCVKELFSQNRGGSGPESGGRGQKRGGTAALVENFEQLTNGSRKRMRLPPAELSRQEKGLRLIGEDAKAAAAAENNGAGGNSCSSSSRALWEYPLMDEDRRCFVGCLRNQLSRETLKSFFDKVLEGTEWVQPLDPRSLEPIPRKTAWMVAGDCSCSYKYGGVDVDPQKFPTWMEEIMQVYMPMCGLTSKSSWPNSCNLNLYKDGAMSVGWHADDERLFQGKASDIRIISLSLGCTRRFDLRLSIPLPAGEGGALDGEDRGRCSLELEDGDLCTMEGLVQKHYQHRVPKSDAREARLNLTWRWVRCHYDGCPGRPVT